MERTDKELVVAQLTEQLRTTESLIVADYRGLTNSDLEALRGKLREHGARFTVVKNTLTRRAAAAAGADALLALLEGPSAIAFVEAGGEALLLEFCAKAGAVRAAVSAAIVRVRLSMDFLLLCGGEISNVKKGRRPKKENARLRPRVPEMTGFFKGVQDVKFPPALRVRLRLAGLALRFAALAAARLRRCLIVGRLARRHRRFVEGQAAA